MIRISKEIFAVGIMAFLAIMLSLLALGLWPLVLAAAAIVLCFAAFMIGQLGGFDEGVDATVGYMMTKTYLNDTNADVLDDNAEEVKRLRAVLYAGRCIIRQTDPKTVMDYYDRTNG